jgi:hypothetical protein
MIQAMAQPVRERRALVWSANSAEQRQLEQLAVGGALPENPGPFAMAVVNNGGGNKLDAYLKVRTTYDPGTCRSDVRLGQIAVQLDNRAPSSGLPAYVTPRSDLIRKGVRDYVLGSNRIMLDVYGPVGGQAAVVTLDGDPVFPVTGTDRSHPVWRVIVPIDPGQKRVVRVAVAERVSVGTDASTPVVVRQPMVGPVHVTSARLQACRDS